MPSLSAPLRRLVRESSLGRLLRRVLPGALTGVPPASSDYRVVEPGELGETGSGWKETSVAERQEAAFAPVLDRLRAGSPREDFVALAAAVRRAGLEEPLIVEVGCGGAWNFEVLTRLSQPFRYMGLDCSEAMLRLAERKYPRLPLAVGDAVQLPFADASCDVLLSGTVLMHLAGYAQAIEESRRVTRSHCIFHTVPVVSGAPGLTLTKKAYGTRVAEIVFNEGELRDLFHGCGFRVVETFESLPYDLSEVLGEATRTRTYLCEVS